MASNAVLAVAYWSECPACSLDIIIYRRQCVCIGTACNTVVSYIHVVDAVCSVRSASRVLTVLTLMSASDGCLIHQWIHSIVHLWKSDVKFTVPTSITSKAKQGKLSWKDQYGLMKERVHPWMELHLANLADLAKHHRYHKAWETIILEHFSICDCLCQMITVITVLLGFALTVALLLLSSEHS